MSHDHDWMHLNNEFFRRSTRNLSIFISENKGSQANTHSVEREKQMMTHIGKTHQCSRTDARSTASSEQLSGCVSQSTLRYTEFKYCLCRFLYTHAYTHTYAHAYGLKQRAQGAAPRTARAESARCSSPRGIVERTGLYIYKCTSIYALAHT